MLHFQTLNRATQIFYLFYGMLIGLFSPSDMKISFKFLTSAKLETMYSVGINHAIMCLLSSSLLRST